MAPSFSYLVFALPLSSSFSLHHPSQLHWASQVAPGVKNPPAKAGDVRNSRSVPGWARSPGGGHGNLLQDSCLESPMDRGAWLAILHSVTECKESDTTEVTAHTAQLTQLPHTLTPVLDVFLPLNSRN